MNAPLASARRAPRLANVQALRAVAAILVVLIHMTLPHVGVEDIVRDPSGPWLWPFGDVGNFGVDLFFVISGFIMLVTNWDAFGTPGAGPLFLLRRAIRIYPPYWLATLPVFVVFLVARDRYMVSHASGETGIVESFLLLPNPHRFVLTVGWTLVWEMLFYAIFAAMLPCRRRYVPALLAAWFALELVLNHTLAGNANFYLAFAGTSLPIEFIYGCAIGLLYVHRRLPPTRWVACAAAIAVAAAWGYRIVERTESAPFDPVYFFGIPAALVVCAAVAAEARGGRVAPRALVALGDGSYAVYLWHISLLVLLRIALLPLHLAGPVAHGVVIVAALVAIVAAGQAIFTFVERPMTAALHASLRRAIGRGKPPFGWLRRAARPGTV